MNIYVGNLSWNTTGDDLNNLFSQYGEVSSAKIVTDKFNNNRSKGFGFVEMPDDEAAKEAISNLHETELDGRKITVNESSPRKEGGGGGGFKKRSFGGGGGGYKGGGGNRGGGGGYRGGGGGNRGGGYGGGNRGGGDSYSGYSGGGGNE